MARAVTAASRDAAAFAAFEVVQSTPQVIEMTSWPGLAALDMAVEETVDLEPGVVADGPDQGFIFYDESESDMHPGYYEITSRPKTG